MKLKFKEREILILGGTGSLGKTITNALIAEYNVKGIRIYSRDEYKQWMMQNELSLIDNKPPISFLIGDVRDCRRLRRAVEGVDFIINCAAMKQVPACEYNPMEAVKTNIHGAENIIDCAIDAGVEAVMHVSTDKAVYPINLYGATKTVAEKLFIHANVYSPGRTVFSCCRYGNVLGSRGSIIPLFREQAKHGEVTITHPEMTRFWIDLPTVAQFILNSMEETTGTEIFIPKMKSMNIMDLADIIAPNAKKNIVGIRQGEKLHETLITEEESLKTNDYETSYCISPLADNWKSESFTYDSFSNPDKMSKEDLQKFLEGIK